MKLTLPNRNQVLFIFLLLAVVSNTYFHFTSPAYKYYRDQLKEFDDRYNAFRDQIKEEFIPAIILLATNSNNIISSPSTQGASLSSTVYKDSLGTISGSYFSISGKPYFRFDNFDFTVNDDFFGYPILGITPTIVTTSQGFFYLRDPPYFKQKDEVDKNGRSTIL